MEKQSRKAKPEEKPTKAPAAAKAEASDDAVGPAPQPAPISDKLRVRKTTEGYLFFNGSEYVGGLSGANITEEKAREWAKKIEKKLGL